MAQEDVFKKLVSHCKEYGFVFPSSDIYDGLGAVYDYGQMGVELKNNIKKYWWDSMVLLHENIVGIDSAIFMHPTIWKASGHVDAFNDPLIDNKDSKKRYRADVLIEDQLAKYDDKINKEVAKAAKRFGESFDEAQFRSTNGRVLEHQAKRDALHTRFAKALNDGDLEELRQIIIDEEIVCPISGTKNLPHGLPHKIFLSTIPHIKKEIPTHLKSAGSSVMTQLPFCIWMLTRALTIGYGWLRSSLYTGCKAGRNTLSSDRKVSNWTSRYTCRLRAM